MGFQSGVNQAIGTIGAMASVKKVVEGQQEGLAKQEESNKLAKESNEQLEAQKTLLAIDEADKINQEYLQNDEAIKSGNKELTQLNKDINEKSDKQSKTKSKRWQVTYQKAIDEMSDRMESLTNIQFQLMQRQKALMDRTDIINKTTGGKLKDYLYVGMAKKGDERNGKE